MAIKKIKDIYTRYFQKSKVFLHPALGCKKDSNKPIETYLCWDDITLRDRMLICLYHLRDDMEFVAFERKMLLGNPLFHDFRELEDNKAAYIFNLEEFSEDFDKVVEGKYSKLSDKLKKKIREYHGATTANYAFVDSYLYPEKYIDDYAKFLCPDPLGIPTLKASLLSVGELCSKPDLDKETLKAVVKVLDLSK